MMIKHITNKLILFITLGLLFTASSLANEEANPKQNIRGTIINFRNQMPIAGVTVHLLKTKKGAYSTQNGSFTIKDVPTGRYSLKFSSIGYEAQVHNIVISSGKEVKLNIKMIEKITSTEELVVKGSGSNFKPINSAVLVSAHDFNLNDLERFSGSRMDPARMVQNFAGVLGANDTRNDIIIRGGAPTELLWRLDGLDIPNPNHFATRGATGGPVNAINSTLLDNSDFLTGAFPAEYGDKLSGVFDLRTRKGNDEKYEYMGQFGFNGFEFGAEGPIKPLNASFIANYRYSFLNILDGMGIDFGFTGIPEYQDAMLKLHFDPSEKDQISATGLFGQSDIYIKESEQDDVYTGDMDTKNGTDLLSGSIRWQHIYSDKVFTRLLLGSSYSKFRTRLDSITTNSNNEITSSDLWYSQNSYEGFNTAKYSVFYSPSKKHSFTLGTELRSKYYNFDESRETISWDDKNEEPWKIEKSGSTWQSMNFINWNWRLSDDITINSGFHTQYLGLNSKLTFEPRLGISWKAIPYHTFTFAYGVHRQSLPLIIHYSEKENKDLDFMQSVHYVGGYTYSLSEDAMIKAEVYYKDLSNVPISADELDEWSFMNSGANFGSVRSDKILKSDGTGHSYGAELSFIKHFSDGYYITSTASLVRQRYVASDGKERRGAFDNGYILNILAGYEWVIDPSFIIEFSGKYTRAGGTPYTPIDLALSRSRERTEYNDALSFTKRNPDYSRFDIMIEFRNNYESFSIVSFISVENLFNVNNVLSRQYDIQNDKVETINQLGIFPVGGFRIEF